MGGRRISVYILRSNDRRSFRLEYVHPDTNKRHGKSAKTDNPSEAEKARADWEYELNHGIDNEPSKIPWEMFRERYEEEKLAGLREGTQKKAGYVFDAFEELASPKALGVINHGFLSRYIVALRKHGHRPATIQGHLAYLKAAMRWASDQRLIPSMPKFPTVKVPKKKHIRKIVLEEFERLLLLAPDACWAAFMQTAWYTGMRRNEMLDLVWEAHAGGPWIDLSGGRIQIPAAYNKSDADQWLPLHPELAKVLMPMKKAHGKVFPLSESPREVSRKFSRLAKKARLKITLHDLRRSFGSRYASVVPAPVLQRLMRHADIKTTLAYYADVDDVLDEAILKA